MNVSRRIYHSLHMEYLALYRKYRPQVFGEVIGQEHVTNTLVREARERRVAHAYLFAGPRGTGKTSTARILAKAINCEDPRSDGEPCDRCATCQAISDGSSLDVQELDAASHNSVENIRDIRVQVTMVAARPSAHRVFILDEAHMLSVAACNALLKTLEEPPPNVHFILATTEPYKLLDTIRSRSQRFDFLPVPAEVLTRHLRSVASREGYEVAEDGLETVSRHADGSVRDSLSLLEQVAALGDGRVDPEGVERALGVADRDTMNVLAKAVADRDAAAVLSLVARLDGRGVNLRSFVSEGIGFFRGTFLAHHLSDPGAATDDPPEVVEAWKAAAKILSVSDVNRVIDQLGDALIRIREGREERLMLELALLWIVRPETSVHPAALLARIEALEARIGEGTRPQGDARPSVSPAASGPRKYRAGTGAPAPAASTVPSGEKELQAPAVSQPAAATTSPPEDAPVETGPLTLEKLAAMWTEIAGTFGGMLGALLRPTNPVALEGDRLVVDCENHFRLLRLEDSDSAALIGDEIKRRTGQRIRVEYVNQATQGVTSPTLERAASHPSSPSAGAEPQERRSEPDPPGDKSPLSPSRADADTAAPDEVPGPEEEPETNHGESDADLKAFFEAAEISITEVKHPSGPSLF